MTEDGKLTLLVVDDDLYSHYFREVRALRDAFDLLEADSLDEAVPLIDEHIGKIDFALIDLMIDGPRPRALIDLASRRGIYGEHTGYMLAAYLTRKAGARAIPWFLWTVHPDTEPPEGVRPEKVISKKEEAGFGTDLPMLLLKLLAEVG